jgi:hypothetical protein
MPFQHDAVAHVAAELSKLRALRASASTTAKEKKFLTSAEEVVVH